MRAQNAGTPQTRTTADDCRIKMMPRKETVGTPEKLGSPGVVQAADQGNADAQRSLTVAAPRGQPNIGTSAATIASSGTTQQDGEAATQAARLGAANRASERALNLAQETVLNPAQETGLNEGVLRARACIRDNIRAAYQSSESVDQVEELLRSFFFGDSLR
jgi:dihydroxyacetone kinase DhaKLM complex PTS-EIIA-like component DhaM